MGVPIDLNPISAGLFSADGYNANNAKIEEAVGKALDRTGSTDNAMAVDFDMGLNNIFNVKSAILSHQAVPLQQVRDLLSASSTEVTSLVDVEDRYVATGGETEIVLENITYVPGTNSLMVFKNGEYQRAGFEYTETGTDRIDFAVGLVAADEVDIFGSRYDAEQFVGLAITAANNAETSESNAETFATNASDSADAAAAAAGYLLEVNNQTGVTYTLQLADEGDFVRMDNAAANTLVVPTNASVAFQTGTIVLVRQIGEGTTTITPAVGVTVNVPFNNYEIAETDFGVALVKVAADEWDMIKAFGGVATSDLVAFTQEFDARLDDFYAEILSSDPTFVVNFDSLQNNIDAAIENTQSEFSTLETTTNQAVTDLTAAFNVIDSDFTNIQDQFTPIQNDFATIQNDFGVIQSDFNTIQNDFTNLQNEFNGFDQKLDDTNDAIDALNLDGDFTNALFEEGYQRFPGGLYIQWGKVRTGVNSGTTVTYPVPFPNNVLNVSLTPIGKGADRSFVIYEDDVRPHSVTSTNFIARQYVIGDRGGAHSSTDSYWTAIGY